MQRVVLEGSISENVSVTSGVPQGSVLGPVLFLLYINDPPNSLTSKVRLFADDAIVYSEINSISYSQILQQDLDKLTLWEKTWLMKFNPIKCEVLLVTRKRNPVAYSYSLHNETLRRLSSTKYLGVTICSDLNWNRHISNITGRANHTNIKTRSQKIRSMAYKALVRPRLEYCASVWDPHTQCAVQRLEMVRRRAARYVMRRYHKTSSVTHMLDHLQWPLLSQRRSCIRLVFLYKIVNQLVAIPPDLYITSHQTNTRTHQHAFLPFLCSTNS